jgi:hypothetical protein
MQLLLKQGPSAADIVASTFKLTEAEKTRLTQFSVGEGLFFAGLNHVVIRILASQTEHDLITTNPAALEATRTAAAEAENQADTGIF